MPEIFPLRENESVSLPATAPRDQPRNVNKDSAGPEPQDRDADDQVDGDSGLVVIVPAAGIVGKKPRSKRDRATALTGIGRTGKSGSSAKGMRMCVRAGSWKAGNSHPEGLLSDHRGSHTRRGPRAFTVIEQGTVRSGVPNATVFVRLTQSLFSCRRTEYPSEASTPLDTTSTLVVSTRLCCWALEAEIMVKQTMASQLTHHGRTAVRVKRHCGHAVDCRMTLGKVCSRINLNYQRPVFRRGHGP